MEIIFRNSRKVKGIRISVKPGGLVTVTKPFFVSKKKAEALVNSKKDWLEESIRKQIKVRSLKSTRQEYLKNKEESRKLIISKIKELNNFYKFDFNRVMIKNQSTRWGSCSSLKNLSFNWQVAKLSNDLLVYVVVHELCHLKEMNHSLRFWDLVSRKVPNFKIIRKRLLKEGINLI
jgi:hypothetical protein